MANNFIIMVLFALIAAGLFNAYSYAGSVQRKGEPPSDNKSTTNEKGRNQTRDNGSNATSKGAIAGRGKRPQDDDNEYQQWKAGAAKNPERSHLLRNRNIRKGNSTSASNDTATDEEDDRRYANFQKNRDFVSQQNQKKKRGEVDFEVAVNFLADLNDTELAARRGFKGKRRNTLAATSKESLQRNMRAADESTTLKPTRNVVTLKARPTTRVNFLAMLQSMASAMAPTTRPSTTTTTRGSTWPTTRRTTTTRTTTQVTTTTLLTTTTAANGAILDWRLSGAVSPVRDQGQCGSCWAFSAAGALEGRLAIEKKTMVPLSVQNFIDCAGDYGGWGCEGGAMEDAFDYVYAKLGVNSWSAYPYVAVDQTCSFNSSARYAPISTYFSLSRDESLILQALQSGPVCTSMDASARSFSYYASGVYSETACDPTSPDHALLIVGYGEDPTSKKPFWLVKNTWSTSWGEAGYIRILRGNNTCGIEGGAVVPILA